jgi:hypothetical protein
MNKLKTFFLTIKMRIKRILKKINKTLPGPESISLLESERKDLVKEQMSMDIQNSKFLAESGFGV